MRYCLVGWLVVLWAEIDEATYNLTYIHARQLDEWIACSKELKKRG